MGTASPRGPRPIEFTVASRLFLSVLLALPACSLVPTSGPSAKAVADRATSTNVALPIQVVDVDDATARRLLDQRRQSLFSTNLGDGGFTAGQLGAGDVVEVSIWEAPPATLFGVGTDPRVGAVQGTRPTVLPEQVIDREGMITVPFAGRIRAAGHTPQEIGADIVRSLRGKANRPEVVVRQTRNTSATVTVVGEVQSSVRMPLTAAGERLLDALAAAGGVRQPVSKMTVQVTRGADYHAMPLDQVIRDPRQNVALRPGDVVTAMYQPLSFTALGATGKNEEVNFEAQGITLAQGLARVGGLVDARSDAQGVFVFRLEQADALEWPNRPAVTTPEGRVPVVYRFDLRDPGSFFVMQSFALSNRDVLYVSNAPAAELQKFLNLVFSIAYPVISAINATK